MATGLGAWGTVVGAIVCTGRGDTPEGFSVVTEGLRVVAGNGAVVASVCCLTTRLATLIGGTTGEAVGALLGMLLVFVVGGAAGAGCDDFCMFVDAAFPTDGLGDFFAAFFLGCRFPVPPASLSLESLELLDKLLLLLSVSELLELEDIRPEGPPAPVGSTLFASSFFGSLFRISNLIVHVQEPFLQLLLLLRYLFVLGLPGNFFMWLFT